MWSTTKYSLQVEVKLTGARNTLGWENIHSSIESIYGGYGEHISVAAQMCSLVGSVCDSNAEHANIAA